MVAVRGEVPAQASGCRGLRKGVRVARGVRAVRAVRVVRAWRAMCASLTLAAGIGQWGPGAHAANTSAAAPTAPFASAATALPSTLNAATPPTATSAAGSSRRPADPLAPASLGHDWLLVKHEPGDPLNDLLWQGDPTRLLQALPAGVRPLVVALGEPGVTPPGRWPAGSVLAGSQALPVPVREALARHGHELREVRVQVEGAVHRLHGLGGGGIGRAVGADPLRLALAHYGNDACGDKPPAESLQGRAVLVRRGGCPYVEKARAALRAGAAALVVVNNELALGRVAGACPECDALALAALPREEGERLLAWHEAARGRGEVLTVELTGRRAQAQALRVGRDGRTEEIGFLPYAFAHLLKDPADPFALLAKEGEYLAFDSARRSRLREEERSGRVQVLPVFVDTLARDPKWQGVRVSARVALPPALLRAGRLEWDLTLACEGVGKAQCPPWDYLVHAYLCEQHDAPRCELEVGRWITPYWSGGRWVHDATALLGLLRRVAAAAPRDAAGRAQLRFEFHSIQPYRVGASLRFHRALPGAAGHDTQPLAFPGGPMTDGRYAERQPRLTLAVPAGVRRVELAVLASGHGFADAARCAEFCNTELVFQAEGGPAHVLAQPVAGTELGCFDQVGAGVVPNQGGTWVYGRNGWCPGQAVAWRRVDLSADVARARLALGARAGQLPAVNLVLTHRATVAGRDHDPGPGSDGRVPDARIELTVWAVFERAGMRRAKGASRPR